MVGTGKYRKTGAVWLLIILCGVGLACLALPETAAGQKTTRSEGATEIKVAPDKVILETESITETMGITTSEEPPLDEGGPSPDWTSTYTGTGSNGDNYPTAMTAKQGYVYVTGRTWNPNGNPPNWDYLTIKYNASSGVQLWSNPPKYDSGANGFDEARAIAVDSQGNVYVTGYSTGDGTGADFATIKYSPDGVQLWPDPLNPNDLRGRYNGPGNRDDFATAMTMDSAGNVYVTGASEGMGTGWDYVTIKYSTTGQELWPAPAIYNYNYATDNMAGNRHDVPSAIAVDTTGCVYVTGSSWRSRKVGEEVYNNYDYATVKYQAGGGDSWTKRWDGAGNGSHDYASALVLDGQNNVYVTGSSLGTTSGYDYATIAYTTSGGYLWDPHAKRYDGLTINFHSYARAIALDSQNNVYVTGLSFKNGQSANYATVRYSSGPNGTVRFINGPANDWDEPAAIAVQGSYVYVTGSSYSTDSSDYRTVKYDTSDDFNFLWKKNADWLAHEGATAMAVDAQGNVYVTGFAGRSGGDLMDCVTLKYPPVQ